MVGQGSPPICSSPPALLPRLAAQPALRPKVAVRLAGIGLAAGLLTLLVGGAAAAADVDLRLRVAWGGGEARQWEGRIWVTQGVLEDARPLGLEADEPGSMWLDDEGAIRIRQPSPRVYDALDLRVTGPRNAQLHVQLSGGEDEAGREPWTAPLDELVRKTTTWKLDERGNRLLVERAPGDRLRVRLNVDRLVFAPGEPFELEAAPHLIGAAPSDSLRLRRSLWRLTGDGGPAELWSEDLPLRWAGAGPDPEPVRLRLHAPGPEGVYELRLAVVERRLTDAIMAPRVVAERRVQWVVVGSEPPPAPDAERWREEAAVDPEGSKPWRRLVRHIPGLGPDTIGSGPLKLAQSGGRTYVELGPGQWRAYFLPVSSIGRPHIVEVEYPADEPQLLGVSIMEPDAAGDAGAMGLDSCVQTPAFPRVRGGAAAPPARHRMVLWPRTRSPLVLLVNRDAERPARFGRIRLLAGPERLPPAHVAVDGADRRLLAAYFDKPLFPECFSAGGALDPLSGRALDDWRTFYFGADRLTQYLRYVGYNAAVLPAAAEGAAIYPSRLLEATPKYDTGVFFGSGQDPEPKDVLELVFRLFDREGLQLIPAVQLASPLPELEWLARENAEDAAAIRLTGADGKPWLARHPPRRGMGPYYNPLDERVQRAMVRVVGELAERYAGHRSFAGVALTLSPETYAVLPDPWTPLDDQTMARFSQETGLEVPAETGPERFIQRAALVSSPPVREAWLAWRARRLAALYRRMREELQRRRPGARLYLAAGALLRSDWLQQQLRPKLPGRSDLADALLQIGLDATQLGQTPGVVLLRPQRYGPAGSLAAQAAQWELEDSAAAARLFRRAARGGEPVDGAALYHEPLPLQLTSFDAVSPFGPERTRTWLIPQVTPSGAHNRRRFARALAAADAQVIFDGGWTPLLGQEASLSPLADVFARLPLQPFETVAPAPGAQAASEAARPAEEASPPRETPPVVLRKLAHEDRTYLYAVNDSPWPARVVVELEGPFDCQWAPLGGAPGRFARQGRRVSWRLELPPYGLSGAVGTSDAVSVSAWRAELEHSAKEAATAELAQLLDDVRQRLIGLRTPKPLDVLANPGFEQPAGQTPVPGWIHSPNSAVVDAGAGREGGGALRLTSRGGEPAWIRSQWFPPPDTGRLALWAWLRVEDEQRQPPLRLALEYQLADGRTVYRYAEVGGAGDGPRLRQTWALYRAPFNDLPAAGLVSIRVGFDLMGEGQAWIDDVQVFDLWMQPHERNELGKIFAMAHLYLSHGQLRDCLRLLDGYWPRLLLRFAPPPPQRVADRPSDAAQAGKRGLRPDAARPPAEPRSWWSRWRIASWKRLLPF